MTPYQAKILAHLVFMHSLEPAYAVNSARPYAKIDPHELAGMPELLEKAVQHEQVRSQENRS